MHSKQQIRTINKWFVTSLLLMCFPVIAHAIPISEYQSNLKRAVTALDTLSQVDENETEAAFQNRLGETATMLKSLLPESQPVENGNEICTVNNLWVHQELYDYLRTDPDLRPSRLSMMLERVKAVEDRVNELQRPGRAGMSKDEAKERLSAILNRPEFSYQSKSHND